MIPELPSTMKNIFPTQTKGFLVLVAAGALLFTSCKKDMEETSPDEAETPGVPATGSRDELTKDSIFLYAKEVYLWNDALPSYEQFNPRKYTGSSDRLSNYYQELYDITQLKINPETGRPFEFVSTEAGYPKYSYITDHTSNVPPTTAGLPAVAQVTLEGVGSDFGIALTAVGTQSSYNIYIRYVSPGSPAALNGLSRGDVLTDINGRTLGSGFAADQTVINNAFDQQTIRISGKKSNGTAFTRSLNRMTFNSSPVYRDTVVQSGSRRIAYLALARFSNAANANGPIADAFAKFAAANATDLVVDLRYNGGGYVSTAEYLANFIAPTSANGSVMFSEHFNSTMQSGRANILKNQPLLDAQDRPQYRNGRLVTYFDVDYSVEGNTFKFSKQGGLNSLTNVVFITTGNTASASELVINVLRPYMNVKTVGATSYGKPVGFFPINIDVYDVYYSMFESRNKNGDGKYYAGFAPDIPASDDVTRDFGDPREASFQSAINYIVSGSLSPISSLKIQGKSMSVSALQFREVNREESFKGMIEDRWKVKANGQ
jgi:carboxyl-terminal processing protease